MKCKTCGTQEKSVHFSCDAEIDDATYCGTCFDFHPCGQGAHGEGCSTMVISGPNEDAAA